MAVRPAGNPTRSDWRTWPAWEKARLRWRLLTKDRPEQLTPEGEGWLIWLFLGGRGAGKTRSGAEDMSEFARKTPEARIAFVGPTTAAVRDTMIEGDSGILSVAPAEALRGGSVAEAWNRSMGELYFANGAQVKAFSSERPARLRGPQHHRAWVDEPAYLLDAHLGDALNTTWNNLLLGLRLGQHPRVVVTGTPSPVRLVRQLLERDGVVISKATTYANLANLAPTFATEILSKYEGQRLGRQELLAELLEDVEGALWTRAILDDTRVLEAPIDLSRVVVGVDPSGSEERDQQGIVVAAKAIDGHGYVLADRTCSLSPDGWGKRVVQAYIDFNADSVAVEKNYGGDMATFTVRTAARAMGVQVPIKDVNSSRGKQLRAQPISALYEQGRVHHVGGLPDLEDQMMTWTTDSGLSPDRLDAAVFALTDVMLGPSGPVATHGRRQAAARI